MAIPKQQLSSGMHKAGAEGQVYGARIGRSNGVIRNGIVNNDGIHSPAS
jgi:hypothetical protein